MRNESVTITKTREFKIGGGEDNSVTITVTETAVDDKRPETRIRLFSDNYGYGGTIYLTQGAARELAGLLNRIVG